MVEDLSVAIGICAATAAYDEASNVNDLSIVDAWATRVTLAGTVALAVGQADQAAGVHASSALAVCLADTEV